MLTLGSVLRAYWSMSPPPIWFDECAFVKYLSQADLLFSIFLWAGCWWLVEKYTPAPAPVRWDDEKAWDSTKVEDH